MNSYKPAGSFLRSTLVGALLSLGALTLSCGGSGHGADSAASLSGSVVARADGFSSRPGWAEPGQAWSKSGETLVVVGHAKVRGDQRMEMAFRVSDSYARAELLRFLTVRVVAVLVDEESSGTSVSAEERRVLEERVTTESEALIDDWFVSGRYWERRKDGDEEALHVFSRLEVERSQVEELLKKSVGNAPNLRLTEGELTARLGSRWSRIAQVTELGDATAEQLPGVNAPDWAAAGDGEGDEGFTFVCQARAEDEGKAEALAKARCNEKLCRLFGVQISARTTVTENLNELKAESEVTEQCADVRAVGRKTTNKSSECTDDGCVYWLKQSYPRSAYDAEVERQKQPTIIRQEVVVQEGDVRYRDPAACERSLRQYAAIEGLGASAYQARLGHLNAALQSCQGIDGRDSGLFASLNLLLTKPAPGIVFPEGRGGELRGVFAAVPAGFMDQLQTERFLTTRIQMLRDVVRDAIFPMQLIDAVESRKDAPVSDAAYEELVRHAVKLPFDEKPVSKWHRSSPHAILLGIYHTRQRASATYRAFLLRQLLERSTINCDRPDVFDAEQIANFLTYTDKQVDDEEYAALLTAFRRAPSVQMGRCLGYLVDEKRDSDAVRNRRIRELASLVVEGKVVQLEFGAKRGAPPSGENAKLFSEVLIDATPEERLDLYLMHRGRLVGSSTSLGDLAKRVTYENFGGMGTGWGYTRVNRTDEEKLRDCRSLAGRFRAAHARASDLTVTNTDACECLGLPALEERARAELIQLWTSLSDRTCKHFKESEWPGGHVVWPFPERHWKAEHGTPFRRINDILDREYDKCSSAAGISGLDFTPMLEATLTGDRLTQVKIDTKIDGHLSRMSKKDDSTALVRKEDVLRAKTSFDACFRAAAEGYVIGSGEFEKPFSGTRRVWLEFGDQGTSHGFQ